MDYTERLCRGAWEAGCFKINLENPFSLKSGLLSPYYFSTDNALSNPEVSRTIAEVGEGIIYEKFGESVDPHILAGGELRGVPFAAQLAYRMGWPTAIVRKKAKKHGAKLPVDGLGNYDGKPFILVEDLITDGGSKLGFIDALKEYGECNHCLVIVDRDQGGTEMLAEIGVQLYRMITFNDFFDYILNADVLSDEELKEISEYRTDSQEWHLKMMRKLHP